MKKFETMGVINVTPDSFSDGNQFNEKDAFAKQMQEATTSFDIIDIGAESTAPMNSKVDIDDEIKRLEQTFIPYLKNNPQPNSQLSFDTYKIEVFEWLYQETRKSWGDIPILFNDVSGCVDKDLLRLIGRYEFTYVFCHNLAPSRELASNHIDYCEKIPNDLFIEQFERYFQEGLKTLKEQGTNLLIDPCFGFSKTKAQNIEILNKGCDIFNQFSERVVYGVSRKSFLRPENFEKSSYSAKVLDVTQSHLLNSFLARDKKVPIFRIHDKASLEGLKIANEVLISDN